MTYNYLISFGCYFFSLIRENCFTTSQFQAKCDCRKETKCIRSLHTLQEGIKEKLFEENTKILGFCGFVRKTADAEAKDCCLGSEI